MTAKHYVQKDKTKFLSTIILGVVAIEAVAKSKR